MNHIEPKRGLGGRPTKFTPPVVKTILAFVRRGLPLKLAASAAGVSYPSLYSWRQTNPQFAEDLQRAAAEGADARLKRIEAASADDWRASAWLLEHCMPEHFAKSRLEVTAADGTPLSVQICLPAKESSALTSEVIETTAITEGKND